MRRVTHLAIGTRLAGQNDASRDSFVISRFV
jgi:hypothetical protein